MPSNSLEHWRKESLARLDEIAAAHESVGGNARGRRYATLQINYAYVVLLSAEFQRFCRNLHSESVDQLVSVVTPKILKTVLREEFLRDRTLDKGNPNAGNLGRDFNRLGVQFWHDVKTADR